MMERWRRNRRRILTLAAAGAAGAATAYAVYKWWYADGGSSEPDKGSEDEGQRASGSGSGGAAGSRRQEAGVLIDPQGRAGTAQMDAEAHLQHHFDSIQDIADSTTLPSLLPALSRALAQAADVDGPLERLRQAKEGRAPLSPADKLAAWEELKVAAFVRAAGAAWLLPLLDLFVRVQLNILGRHLYLESAVEGSGMARPAGLPKLSAPSQERFLSFAEFLAQQGAAELLALMRAAAEARLAGVALQETVAAGQVQQLLAGISEEFAERLAAAATGGTGGGSGGGGGSPGRGWARFLLPPPAEVHASLAPRAPDNRAMLLGADALLVDARVVEELVAEAEAVAAGDEFAAAVAAGSQAALAAAATQLAAGMGAARLPLAKAVPLVAAVGGDLLAVPSLRPVLAQLEPVRSLSARVYGCCYL
ncbi:hypothetical protein ABPG75_013253 [Micractinium tetrahymenae]